MNEQSPLVPQGSLIEQKNKNRTRVKIAVFFVLAVHGIALIALLVQGCTKEEHASTNASSDTTTNIATTQPDFAATPPGATTNVSVAPPAATPTVEPPAATAAQPIQGAPAAPIGTAQDYKVAKGDNYTTIGRKFGVTVKELSAANPGVESSRLHIGQTLHIPAPTKTVAAATAPASMPSGAVESAVASGEQPYSVVSGDNLTKIAAKFGTSVKAIRTANNLTTDRLVVGQKIRVPAKAAAAAGTASTMEQATATPVSTTPGVAAR